MRHYLPTELTQDRVRVALVGAGGSGSHMVANLAVLHQTMLDLGHPGGLHLTVFDDDTVSQANVGRSLFYECDVGLNKAIVAAQRVNMCYGLDFDARPRRFDGGTQGRFALVVGCVDSRAGRRAIWKALTGDGGGYWLDLGNDADDGQVILGCVAPSWRRDVVPLPCVMDLFPEMRDAKKDPRDPGPSCSRAEALRRQSAFVNKQAALHAVTLLGSLFRDGYIDHHGMFFNVRTGRSTPLACDPATWARFGYTFNTGKSVEKGAGTPARPHADDRVAA